jgi:hypothetical protein
MSNGARSCLGAVALATRRAEQNTAPAMSQENVEPYYRALRDDRPTVSFKCPHERLGRADLVLSPPYWVPARFWCPYPQASAHIQRHPRVRDGRALRNEDGLPEP